jgi:hypothetical protein
VQRIYRSVMLSVVLWLTTMQYIEVTRPIATKHMGMAYGVRAYPTVTDSTTVARLDTVIPHWAMPMRRWRSWLQGMSGMLSGATEAAV